jgi:molybdopterin converting factor small subunit
MISVSFGANTASLDVAGQTVGDLREQFGGPVGVTDEVARVNNSGERDDSYILRDGDVVEFVKRAGEKG